MSIKSTYGVPADPLTARILHIIGPAGLHLWDDKTVDAVLAEFEANQCAAISSDQFMAISRAMCPRSADEVEDEDPDDAGVQMFLNNLVAAILDELEKHGMLTFKRFAEIHRETAAKSTAQLALVLEMAKAGADYPVAGVSNRIGKVN